jgi:SAM-dependent methyltransferase
MATRPRETLADPDVELKARHRAMWASGDYPSMVETFLTPLGPRLVDACRIGPEMRVLDVAAGTGNASIPAAERGARVTASDLVPELLEAGRERAGDLELDWVQADAEHLPFADGSFDAVWGSAILHHLDLKRAGEELRRVLKPGGVAVFCEPWGGNRLLEFARKYLPYPGKHRTPDERPLRSRDLDPLRQHFPALEFQGFQFLGMLRRVFRRESLTGGWLDQLDSGLLWLAPPFKNWCRYVVIRLRNE